jgi:hypothetical protein
MAQCHAMPGMAQGRVVSVAVRAPLVLDGRATAVPVVLEEHEPLYPLTAHAWVLLWAEPDAQGQSGSQSVRQAEGR